MGEALVVLQPSNKETINTHTYFVLGWIAGSSYMAK